MAKGGQLSHVRVNTQVQCGHDGITCFLSKAANASGPLGRGPFAGAWFPSAGGSREGVGPQWSTEAARRQAHEDSAVPSGALIVRGHDCTQDPGSNVYGKTALRGIHFVCAASQRLHPKLFRPFNKKARLYLTLHFHNPL